jgi:flagellar biosynthesis protein FlhF
MAAKTFRASSIKEALGQVKASLGAEAMILSTKRVPRGPKNPYGKDVFEITAAANDELPEITAPPAAPKRERRAPWTGGDSGFETEGRRQDLASELSEIKDMLRISKQAGGIPQLMGLHPTCLNLYARFLSAGISESLAWRFMEEGGAFMKRAAVDPEKVTRDVVDAMKNAIEVKNPFSGHTGGCYVAAFVGPTGVGKTTTIAKLSAELSLKQKKKVGIISVDSYRIGAVEQLKTYASIMGLPCLSAFSREDLGKALKKMADRDVILIDTAGQSHRDLERLKELGKLLGDGFSIDTHLVLSAAAKPEDMKAAAKNFSLLAPASYVFTKVDETGTLGGLIDQLQHLKMPVSFITNGQRVPEDILTATRQRILKLVLQGGKM